MSALRACAPCERGDHERHIAHEGPPGLLGGVDCPCPGGCRPRVPDLMAALRSSVDEARAEREKRSATHLDPKENPNG